MPNGDKTTATATSDAVDPKKGPEADAATNILQLEGNPPPAGADASKPKVVGLDQAKEAIESGKPVTIKIDSTKGTDEAAALNKILQGENGFVTLVKPSLQPGSKGYYEVDAPKVTDPVSLSTREKPLSGSYTVDGVSHSVDKFPNGTVFDGKTIRSADPSATGVQIGDSFVPNGTPADAKGGQQTNTGDRIVVRKTTGEDGKPVLDTYPIGDTPGPNGEPSSFQQRWDTAQDGHFKPRPVPTEHTILPGNVTIDSTTKYGEVTIKPGDGFRADGFGVGPKEMRETWNGFSDEKGYQFLKDMYAKNGMAESTQMQTLKAERIKAYENLPSQTVGLDQAKEAIESGKPVTIKIDSTKGTDEAAALNKILQGENGFVTLVKPALQPGSKGYYEIDAPKVTEPVSLSTREKPLTGSYTVDGVAHTVDKFPNGTIFDGKTIRSADPSATGVQIGDTLVPNGTPADAQGGQQADSGSRIIVRKTTSADGKPVLDTYPIGDTPGPNGEPSSFQQRWDTAQDGHFKPRPLPTEHTILPGNVTINSTTKYGEVTIKPGDGFRADGFGVGPKEMRETWNGFSDEKGYQFLKDMYAKNGMADSTQMQTLNAERTKWITESAETPEDKLFNDPVAFDATLKKALAGSDADVVDYISKMAKYVNQPGAKPLTMSQMQEAAEAIVTRAQKSGIDLDPKKFIDGDPGAKSLHDIYEQAIRELDNSMDGGKLTFPDWLTKASVDSAPVASETPAEADNKVWKPGDAADGKAAGFKSSRSGDAGVGEGVQSVAAELRTANWVDAQQLDAAIRELTGADRTAIENMSAQDRAAMAERVKSELGEIDPSDPRYVEQRDSSTGKVIGAVAILAALGAAVEFYRYIHKDDKAEAPAVTYHN